VLRRLRGDSGVLVRAGVVGAPVRAGLEVHHPVGQQQRRGRRRPEPRVLLGGDGARQGIGTRDGHPSTVARRPRAPQVCATALTSAAGTRPRADDPARPRGRQDTALGPDGTRPSAATGHGPRHRRATSGSTMTDMTRPSPLPDGYEFSADTARIDTGRVHRLLAEHTPWAEGRTLEAQRAIVAGSRNYGLYA